MKCNHEPIKCEWQWCATRRLCLLHIQEITKKTQNEIINDVKHWPAKYKSNTKQLKPLSTKSKRVFERDNYKCVYCESMEDLTIDHIHPKSKGGKNHFDNYQTLCDTCNGIKGNLSEETLCILIKNCIAKRKETGISRDEYYPLSTNYLSKVVNAIEFKMKHN